MIATILLFASFGAIIFATDYASAGPIVLINITGQQSGTSIETGDPGQDILFDVRVENNGDTIATINLTIIGTPVTWGSTLTGTDFTVSAGSSVTEILTVHIYEEALETATASMTVKDSTNNKQDTCTVNVDQTFGLIYESADTIKSSLPDSIITFTLPINNTGNGVDTTSFSDIGAPQDWEVSYDNTKNLPAFSLVNFGVSVYIPAGTNSGTYSVSMTGTSEDTITTTTKTLTITVEAEYGLIVTTLPSASLEVSPGGKATYTLEVTNEGNAQDRFDLAIESKTVGWTVTLLTQTTPKLSAGESYEVTMHVRSPINALDSDLGYANVTVSSQENESQNETAFTITTILQERYLSLGVDNSTVSGAQDDTVTFNFELTNSGNGQDRVDITATPPDGWSSPNISPIFFTLDSGQTDQFTVQQTIPSDALNEGYTLLVTAQSRDDANASTQASVTVDVDQEFGVQVSIPGSNSKDVNPGDTVSYTFDVKNKGNGEDTFSIDQSGIPAGWSWVLSDSSVTINPGEIQTVNLTVTVPGDYEQFGPLEAEVIATSDGDAQVSDNSSKIIINIQKFYNVVLSSNSLAKSAFPEEVINYTITITNEGNAEDLIKVEVDDGPYSDWTSLDSSLFTIGPNNNSVATLSVEIPDNQEAAKYYINLTATSEYADDKGLVVTDTISTKTTVKPLYEVYLFPDGGNLKEAAAGESVAYMLGVQNRGLDVDTFDMEFSGDYPFTNWVVMDYENYTVTDLASNAIQQISFSVDIPANVHENHPGLTSGIINITGTSRGDPDQSYAISFETVVKAEYGATLSTENDYDSAMPGSNASFTVTLKNTGSSASDIFGVKEKDSEFENIYISPSTIEINRSATVEITITVTIDEDAKMGTHMFNITAKSAGADGILSGGDEIVATLSLEIRVEQKFDIRATCSQNAKEIAPGEYVLYEIEIENQGNGEDTFDITKYSSNVTHLGWAVLDASSLTLDSEEIVTVEMNITIPSNTEPINVNIYVNISSRENDTAKVSVRTITTVTQKYALRLTSNDLNKDADPDSIVTFNIDIKNDGTGTDQFELTVVSEGAAGAQASWVSIPIQDTIFTLSPSELKRVVIDVSIPADTEVGDYQVSLKAESLRSIEDVEDTITATVTVNPKRDISLELPEDRKEIVPNLSGDEAEVPYDLKVINKGTDTDQYKLQIMGAPYSDHPSWVRLSTKTISSLSADAEKTVTVTIEIPNNEAPTSSDGFNTVIYVYSPGESGTADDIGMMINITTVIKTAYGLELSANSEKKETPSLPNAAARYRTVSFPFSVENLGTGDDAVKFEIEDKPDDWNDVSIDLSTEDLAEGAKINALLTVNVDREVATGNYDIKVKVTSRGDDSLYVTDSNDEDENDEFEEITFTVKVTVINEVKITSPKAIQEGNPGSTVTYTIKVENLGNEKSDISLKLPNTLVDWASSITISPSSISLDAKGGSNDEAEATMTVRISSDYSEALSETYVTMITAEAGDRDDMFTTTLNLSTTIHQEYGLDLSSTDWDKDLEVDNVRNPSAQTVRYSFKVENTGNGRDRYELELSGDYAKWAKFDNDLTTKTTDYIEAGETLLLYVDVIVDINDKNDFEEFSAGDYDITLKVTSMGDDTKYLSTTLSITIEEAFYVILTPYSDAQTITMNPSEKITYTYKIDAENAGNKDDTVKFQVKDYPDDWSVSFSPSSRKVDIGSTETINLEISPDSEVEEGNYYIKVRAQSSDGTYSDQFSITVTIELPVLELNKPVIDEDKLKAGEEIDIVVTLENTGLGDAEDITVNFYDDKKLIGSADVSDLKAGDSEEITFSDWNAEDITSGEHKIRVTVSQPLSGEEEEEEKKIEVPEELGFFDELPKGSLYTIGILGVIIIILIIIIIALFSRTRRSLPEDYKDEIAKAKSEGDEEEEEEEEEEVEDKKLLASKERPALPEKAGEEGEEGEDKKPPKKVKIKCPKCNEIQTVTSPKRPLEFECDECGMRLILKK